MGRLHRLEPDAHPVVAGLAAGLADQGMALSVLAGIRPGVVLVNDAQRPTSLFLGAPEGGFAWSYLTGDPSDAMFHRALNGWLFGEHALGPDVVFSFFACDSPAWEKGLPEIVAPRTVIPDRRLHYQCTKSPRSWQDAAPAGYRVEAVDRTLLESGIALHEKVSQWMTANFGSIEGFLSHGLGAVAIREKTMVAWALADSLIDGLCDIGVETEEDHRRKGLSTCVTRRAIELAFERGADRVGWHCHPINVPSIRTAERAGFEFRCEYTVYPVRFDPEKHEKLVRIIAREQ